jgi:excisionase family DNA binding protein
MTTMYTTTEVADQLKVKPATVRTWVSLNKIGAVKLISGAIRIPAAELEAFVAKASRSEATP